MTDTTCNTTDSPGNDDREVLDSGEGNSLVSCSACDWWAMTFGPDHRADAFAKGREHYTGCHERMARLPSARRIWELIPHRNSGRTLTVAEMAETLGEKRSNLSRSLIFLEQSGYIERIHRTTREGQDQWSRVKDTMPPADNRQWGTQVPA